MTSSLKELMSKTTQDSKNGLLNIYISFTCYLNFPKWKYKFNNPSETLDL